MEAKTKIRIEEVVREILEESDMETTTEHQIRKKAGQKLGLDLNESQHKAFVRHVVNNFLQELKAKQEAEECGGSDSKQLEYDDDGDLIVCRLSDKRRVTIQNFRGTTLVSIREFYKKDGKELPTAKGISLKEEQWDVLKKNIPAIEKAIRKMEARV